MLSSSIIRIFTKSKSNFWNRIIICLSKTAIILLILRFFLTGRFNFLYLIWNLFLAWIPYCLIFFVQKENVSRSWKGKSIFFLFLWLIFFPNAPYLITDFIHLKDRGVPLWFDWSIFFSFALCGIIIGLVSLDRIQNLIIKKSGKIQSWLAVFSICFLSGFAITLGRFLRWNSWDIILNPIRLFKNILKVSYYNFPFIMTWSLRFSLLLIVHYLLFRLLSCINRSTLHHQNYKNDNDALRHDHTPSIQTLYQQKNSPIKTMYSGANGNSLLKHQPPAIDTQDKYK